MNDVQTLAHVVRQVVGGVEPTSGLGDNLRCEARIERLGQRTLDAGARLEHSRQALPFHPLHGEVEHATLFPQVEDLANVWVVNARGNSRFVEKHRLELRVHGQMREDGLDGDDLAEAALAVLLGSPHASHPALRHAQEDLVAPEAGPRSERLGGQCRRG